MCLINLLKNRRKVYPINVDRKNTLVLSAI